MLLHIGDVALGTSGPSSRRSHGWDCWPPLSESLLVKENAKTSEGTKYNDSSTGCHFTEALEAQMRVGFVLLAVLLNSLATGWKTTTIAGTREAGYARRH